MTNNRLHKNPFFKINRDILVSLFLIISTLAVYWQVTAHGFVYYDDDLYVAQNNYVQAGLSSEGLIWAFSFSSKENTYWHPLTWLSHMLDCQLYGLRPGLHHLTSVILHIANSLLLFIVLKRMSGARWRSAFVAALFALHPLNVDSVAWLAERKSVLSTFFSMLTMLTYAYYSKRPGLSRYALLFGVFSLGLLAKPMLVTLPFVLLLLDYWPLGRLRSGRLGSRRSPAFRLVLEKLPLLGAAVLSIYSSSLSLQLGNQFISTEQVPMNLRIANALVSYASYIGKMFWPQNLAVYYPYPSALPVWQTIGAGLFLVCVSVFVIRALTKMPYLAVGWLWYLGALMPVIGLVQGGDWPAMADRWTYVPLIGLFVAISWGVPELVPRWRYKNKALAIIAATLLSILMATTWLQARLWADSVSLFKHALDVTSNNYLAFNNLGTALAKEGRTQEAITYFREALRIRPHFGRAHYNLGIALAAQGKLDEAIDHYSEVLRLKPDHVGAHNNLGAALFQKEKINEAIYHFQEALRIRPKFAKANNNLKRALAAQREIDNAITKTQQALKLNPAGSQLHYRLGNLYQKKGELDLAIEQYETALSIQPRFIRALNKLAMVFSVKGKYDKAISLFKTMTQLRPDSKDAYYNIACIYAKQNRVEESIEWLKKAIKKGYDNWNLIKTDKDLENIRGSSHYKEIIKGN